MTIRQQYANEELVHKLRSMLSDLPTLRTRAIKKLKHWREAAIKRLLARQRELEKTLLDKFERLEFDTQLFVEKIERKKANQQQRWQSEPLDYHNKNEIDRISTSLRSIREELEQSKLILAGSTIDDDMDELLSDDILPAKLAGTPRYGGTLSSKTPVHKNYENNDLGSELKRVLEICTSPQRSSSSLSADELSALQSLDHAEYLYDAKSKQTTAKTSKAIHPKQGSQTVGPQRRNSRTITNVPIQQQQQQPSVSISANDQHGGNHNHKLFAFESFDDSIRRFQRLREIRKNLRIKYDDQSQQQSVESMPPSSSTNGIDNTEPTSDNRSGSHQKPINNPNRPPISNGIENTEPTSDNRSGSHQKPINTPNRPPISNGIDNTEPISDNRSGSHQKPINTPNRPPISNGIHIIPPTPLTIKSTVSTSTTPPPRKNVETRHTLLSREPVSIPIERIAAVPNPQSADPVVFELYNKAANSVHVNNNGVKDSRDRRYRSRTLETHQIQAVDNQIYGCPSKAKPQTHQRSESHKHRSNRLSIRRTSEDGQDKQLQLRRNNEYYSESTHNTSNETWLEIGNDHWTNLLENGWRPTIGTPGVTPVAIADSDNSRIRKQSNLNIKVVDLFEQISKTEYASLFEQLEFAYSHTINLGNEFWRFLEINGDHHLCLYHQLNKQFIMFKPDNSLLCFPWPYDGIVDISWSTTTNTWVVATQTKIIICNRSFSTILQSVDINGDWPKRITSCQSFIFHTHKIPPSSITPPSNSSYQRSSYKDRPQFLLERYDYKLKSLGKHILESSTIWDIEADDHTEHLAILCDVALLIFDYQLNLLKQIEVTGFKVSTDHFGGWLIADYNASCIWQIRRNEYLKANKILHVERPWSVVLDQSTWTLVTLSETQNRAKRLLFFNMKNIPVALLTNNSARSQSQLSISTSSSMSNSSA